MKEKFATLLAVILLSTALVAVVSSTVGVDVVPGKQTVAEADAHFNGCYRRSGSYAGWYIWAVHGPDIYGYYNVYWIQSGLSYTIHRHYCPPYIWPN